MGQTKIEWSNKTWNITTGCSYVSEACQNCYAKTMARRLQKMPGSADKYRNGFKPTIHPDCLNEPYSWKKPTMCFVVSMGDLFHRDVPFEYIDKVVKVIGDCPQHTFQLLTKRTYRMFDYFCNWRKKGVPQNVWLGVTCEKGKYKERIDLLTLIDAPVRFLSCEPLLGDMEDINLDGIDWVITGGESGVRARHLFSGSGICVMPAKSQTLHSSSNSGAHGVKTVSNAQNTKTAHCSTVRNGR